MSRTRRALYLSHTGLTEPLGHSQVLPYVRGLAAAGWDMDVMAFEPAAAKEAAVQHLRLELAAEGISYHPARRSPSHSPVVKAREAAAALARATARSLRHPPRVVHARSDLPGMVALGLSSLLPGSRFLFDCRGLLADEYADSGHWPRGSRRHRALLRVERTLFWRASAVVTLTARLRDWLRAEGRVRPRTPVEVIPCCASLERFAAGRETRERMRQELDVRERFVLTYAGTLGSWYCEDEMARLFAALRRRRPALFAVFTHSPAARLLEALRREGVPDSDVHVRAAAPADMPAYLSAADAGVFFCVPWFSKIASSPVKVAEYLAAGLTVVMNRGVGDGDALIAEGPPIVDAGTMDADSLEAAAQALAGLATGEMLAGRARELARARFSLAEVGIPRYLRLYETLDG